MIRKIDDFVVDQVQQLYDFLWDHFGLFVAYYRIFSIVLSTVSIIIDTVTISYSIFTILVNAVVCLSIIKLHISEIELQKNLKYQILNIKAMYIRYTIGHLCCRLTFTIIMLPISIYGSIFSIISTISALLCMYTNTTKVRQRKIIEKTITNNNFSFQN